MDVTPTPKMFQAMSAFVDSVVGEAPLDVEKSVAAERRREARAMAFDVLHRLVHLSMREGAARAMNPNRTEIGRIQLPTMEQIRGN